MSCPRNCCFKTGVVGVFEGVEKIRWVGVWPRTFANALLQGDRGSTNLDSCLGVSKELRKKFGDVGVLSGVGGSPPG